MKSIQPNQPLGKLITFEGIDGAGKTTHLNWFYQKIEQHLENQFNAIKHSDIDQKNQSTSNIISDNLAKTSRPAHAILTREPGGTPIGEGLRQLILHQPVTKETQTLIMFAARQEHLNQVILPALNRGDWVVCDRFTDATFAYQGGGAGVSLTMLQALEKLVHENTQPDLTFLFDLSPADAFIRRKKRQTDYFEGQSDEYFERVRNSYLNRAAAFPNRYAIIDASQTVENVRHQIEKSLNKFFETI